METQKKRRARQTDFTTGAIVKPMLLFSIPLILGDLFSALYNVVDTIVVGQYVGANAVAAVGCCFVISMVCISVFAGFGMGSGILIAQMFGAKREDQLTATVNTAYIGGFIVSAIMIVVGEILAVPLLKLLKTPEAIMDMATQYLRIFLLGCTGQLYYYMGSNILRGMGDSKWPTYALVFCAVLNIVLDLIFVVALHWDCAGVALATVISQTLSGIAVLLRIYKGGYGIRVTKQNFRIDPTVLKMIMKIGIPGGLNMMVTTVGMLVIQRFTNAFGETLVAANVIIQKIDSFAMLPIMSLCTALTTFVGQNLGAGEEKRCDEGIRKITVLVVLIGAVIGVAGFFLGPVFCRIFVKEAEVIALGSQIIRILAFFYTVYALGMSLSYTIEGAGATQPVMIISLFGILIRVAACYLLGMRTGRWQGLFWATNINFIYTAVVYVFYIWKGNWKKYVQVQKEAE